MGVTAAITAIGALAGAAATIKSSHDQKKASQQAAAIQARQAKASTFNADEENKKIANQEAEANRKRAAMQSETIKTSALGNTGETDIRKKTLLGG